MKLKSVGSNQTEVELGNGVTVFFSYSTAVAAHVPGRGYLRSSTKYSRTTSKHVTQWINGTSAEVEQEEIDKLAEATHA